MTDEENPWMSDATKYGFTIEPIDSCYLITDRITQKLAGKLSFNENKWWLIEPRQPRPMRFEGAHEAIEYLAAVASFGSQLA